MAGQTHYVRSAIGFGLLVGRVTLSVEGLFTAKGELSSLSFTGSAVPRVGAPATGGSTTVAAAAELVTQVLPLKRGDEVVYRLADFYTRIARDVVYAADRLEGEKVLFNYGGRIERIDGTVLDNAVPLAGDTDRCSPPGGWGRPDMMLGMA